jgi:4-aminobutyrate aminotransferase-like enzyme/Ser/Thr protein kinase RdoA (MazF antagonist)
MSLLNHSPQFDVNDAVYLAQSTFGLPVTADALPSERDQNFRLTTDDGTRYVLKIANAMENQEMLDAQQQAMIHLAQQNAPCPQIIPNLHGERFTTIESGDSTTHLMWLISFLDGIPLGKVQRHSPALLIELGQALGQIDKALAAFDHPAIHRHFHWDLAEGLSVVNQYKALVADTALRQLIDQFVTLFEQDVVPILPTLRRSAIHNDANDYNIIVGGGDDWVSRNQQVVGLVDFGDMVHSYTIADLAIAISYAILDKPDPLTSAVQIVQGYHAAFPLPEHELEALFGLVCLRLCVSAVMAVHNMSQRPDDPYLAISQEPIQRMLPKLAQIKPPFATAVFRHACGFGIQHKGAKGEKHKGKSVVAWLGENQGSFGSVLDVDVRCDPVVVFDLSISSPLLDGNPEKNNEPALTARLFAKMAAAGVAVGIGRYDEPRLIYTAPAFAAGKHLTNPHRTIHLGIDLFAQAGTAVYAPLDGTVHTFAINAAHLDYGGVIILRHAPPDTLPFYTLYGHLSHDSLNALQLGQVIKKGEPFCKMGIPAENGGWTPHLHFQIITDLLGMGCDFPGVGFAHQRDLWRTLSPDPNLILGIPADQFPTPLPSKAETLAMRKQRIGRNLSIGYRDYVKVMRGWMQYLYDENGRCYLDAYNNVPHVGHCHPRIVAAAQRQMAILNTNTRYLHDTINELAERLTDTMPDPLSVCFFVNSASEGNELALRLARACTGQRDIIVLEAAYHGHTNGLIDISPYKHDGPGGKGAPAWVHTAPIPDTYRGLYKRDDKDAGHKYAAHVQAIIERLHGSGTGLSGYIAETLPSVGGQIVLPDGYLQSVYGDVRAAGGICIADEVQTGYGRIGTHFYGFLAHDVVPDIVVLGKPIGNGHPLSAVVTTPKIAAAFDNGMEFFSTFGGNTVSCAVGLEQLLVVQEERLQDHALTIGNRMLAGLRPFIDRYPIVGDVRGSGLFLGVELVRNRETLEPADTEASFIVNRMREHGILLGTDGPFHNVIKIRPPMPFTAADADFLMATMDRILAEDFERSSALH